MNLFDWLFGKKQVAAPQTTETKSREHGVRGVAHLQRGEYEQAVREFTEAIRLDPKNVDAYRGRWLAHCSLGDDANGAADERRWRELEPADSTPQQTATSLISQGNSYEYHGHWDKAMYCYSEAIRVDPEAPIDSALCHSAYIYRALLNEKMGHPAAATADWNEAIRLNPDETNRRRAYLHLDKDNYHLLQQEAEEAVNKGDYGNAEVLLRRLVAIQEAAFGPEHPDTGQSFFYLVAVLEGQGKNAQADSLFRRLSSVQLLVAIDSGDVKRALALLEQGANPNARDAGGRTALMYAGLGGQTRVMRRLLETGADANVQSLEGTTALMDAITFGDPQAVQLLVSSGAGVSLQNGRGETALTLAHAHLSNAPEDRSGLGQLPMFGGGAERTPYGDLTFATEKERREVIEVLKRVGAP
jgi:tetratricopeptide (TPR) repeat protein